VEQRYDVIFTYLDENIDGVLIPRPPGDLSLRDMLQFLQQRTGLVFKQLDPRFITISKSPTKSIRVCGLLADSSHRVNIEGAAIRVGNEFATTNAEGYFELTGFSEDSLQIQALGYISKTLSIKDWSGLPCKTITLDIQSTLLQEIVVINYLTEGIDKKTDGSFSIHTKDLGILPGLIETDVLNTIQALPGIQSIDETVSNINVRGGTHDQNLVLWDGIKMYQTGHFFGLISAFSPYLTKEVSLRKNGTSAGLNDGVSSTIAIQSDDRLSQTVTGGAGINMINGDAFAKIPLSPKASLHVSTRRSIADFVKTPTYNNYFDRAFRDTDVAKDVYGDSAVSTNKAFYFYDVGLRFLYNPSPKDKLRVNFLNIHNNLQFVENATVNNRPESKTSSLQQQNMAGGISYSRLWSDRVKTSGLLYFSLYDLDAVNFDIGRNQQLIQENRVLDTGIKLDARLNLTKNIDLLSGYQFFEVGISNRDDINNPLFHRYIKNVLRTQGAFTELDFSSNSNRTNFRVGVRANYLTKFHKAITEPRLSFNQRFLNYFSLEVLGEMKNQTTTQIIDFQNDFLGIEKRRWVLSNDGDIPVIRSRQLSAGIHYTKKEFLVSVEVYFKKINGITSSSQGFQNQFQFIRSRGSSEATGIDFLINKKISRFNSWISYSYADNNFNFTAFSPPSFPNNLHLKHAATVGSSYQSNHFQLSIGFKWHTGKPFTEVSDGTPISGGKINYKSPNTARLGDYLRLDLSAKYSFDLGNKVRAVAGVSFWNLSGRKNIVNVHYQINNNGQISFIEQKSLGFTPNFMFRISF
jgi:hypothetical protein